ncbi:MAG TPA: acetolactate synthase [Planctomycetia bacterium]|nr:acetolactate synthase [Planctomycetia bacterium]
MSSGADEGTELQTIRGRDFPCIRQFSIFSPNRLGQLLALTRRIESAGIRVCALSVADSADCAILRLVVSEPDRCAEVLKQSRYEYCEIELIVVAVPEDDKPLLSIFSTLLSGEIDIHYCFPLLVQPYGRAALAFHVSDVEVAQQLLTQRNLTLLTENDLLT